MQCQAKSKQSGVQCKRHAAPGKRVCAIHGGKTPTGVASTAFKTGRYSKSLPGRLAARYEEAQADPKLLNLRDEIALLDSRIGDLLGRVDTGENGERWKQARKAFLDLRKALTSQDADGIRASIQQLGAAIERGVDDSNAWGEIGDSLDLRRRMVESERSHLKTMQQFVTVEQVMLLVGALMASFKNRIKDRKLLSEVGADIEMYLGQYTNVE